MWYVIHYLSDTMLQGQERLQRKVSEMSCSSTATHHSITCNWSGGR